MNDPFPISEHTIALPSLRRLRYLRAGDGGPLVVCLSGIGLTGDIYRLNLPALAAAGYTACAVDRPGFGGSSGPLGFGLDYANRVLSEFITSQGAGQAALLGNSLGSTEALHFYLRRPEQVSHLALANPFGAGVHYPPSPNNLLVGLPSTVTLLWGRGDNAYYQVARRMFTNPDEVVPNIFRMGKGWRYRLRWSSRLLALLGTAARLGLPHQRRGWLAELSEQYRRRPVPALIAWGTDDPVLPVRHAQELAQILPGAELAIYPGIRHHPPAEIPHLFNPRLIEFLSADPRQPGSPPA